MENIVENNKLIAEFLDWEFDDLSETFETPFLKLVDSYAFGDEQYSCKLQDFELEFHSDWSWLMTVVEKIESLDHCQIDISLNWCRIGYKGTLYNYDSRDYFKGLTKIEAVYNACLEFVKWYNQNKSK